MCTTHCLMGGDIASRRTQQHTVRLFTKNFNSISPPKDTPNVKLCKAVLDLHKLDAAVLAG